MTRWQMMFNK